MNKIISFLIVAVVSLSLLSGVTYAAVEYTQIDENHDLDSTEKIDSFESEGVASADLLAPNMTVTVSETASGVGMSSKLINQNSVYIKFEYNEEKPRHIRFYLPNDYIKPYEDELEAVVGDKKATIEPVREREYTSIELEFEGDQDEEVVIFELSKFSGEASEVKNSRFDLFSGILGEDKETEYNPEAEEWQYINSADIGSSTEISVQNIDGDYSIQYINSEDEWKPVPTEQTSSDPYYIQYRDGIDDTLWVISSSTDTPQIRYKQSKSNIEKASEVSSGITDITESILEDVRGIFN